MSYDQKPQAPIKSSDEKLMLIATHLLGIVVFFIGPLVVYFVSESETVKAHAREALNFQLTLLIGYVISLVLMIVFIGFLIAPALWALNIVFCVIAAVKASEGVLWRYPATIRFV
jgi:uncharacterized protein